MHSRSADISAKRRTGVQDNASIGSTDISVAVYAEVRPLGNQ